MFIKATLLGNRKSKKYNIKYDNLLSVSQCHEYNLHYIPSTKQNYAKIQPTQSFFFITQNKKLQIAASHKPLQLL